MKNTCNTNKSFEFLLRHIFNEEISNFIKNLSKHIYQSQKKYLTMKEVSELTGIGTYTLRELTYARAMPHRKVKGRLVFEENEIKNTVDDFKGNGWTDPNKEWEVATVKSEIIKFKENKGESKMIENILRDIIREELNNFSNELKRDIKTEKTNYYGRTILTIKEAAEYFRTSSATVYTLVKDEGMPHLKIQSRFYIVLEEAEAFLWRETAKSYADEGNIYWQRILQKLDWEEKERNIAYQNALKRLEDRK